MGSCFNLVENAFATRRLALLATSIAFWVILARAWAEIKILRIFDFSVFSFAFRFLETVRLKDWRAICYTVQYNAIRHSTTQLNTKQYNTMHYTICFLGNLGQPGVKTVLKSLNTKQYNTMHYTICFLGNLSQPGVKTVLKAYCIVHCIVLFCVKLCCAVSYCIIFVQHKVRANLKAPQFLKIERYAQSLSHRVCMGDGGSGCWAPGLIPSRCFYHIAFGCKRWISAVAFLRASTGVKFYGMVCAKN